MILSDLSMEGYKSIEEGQSMEFDDFNVFLGENNTGKSSVIDALRDYKEVFPVASSITNNWALSRTTGKSYGGKIRIETSFTLTPQEHDDLFSQLVSLDAVGESQADRWKDQDFFSKIDHELIIRPGPRPDAIHHRESVGDEPTGESNLYTNFQDQPIALREGRLDEEDADYLNFRKLPNVEMTNRSPEFAAVLDLMSQSIASWSFVDAFREPENKLKAERKLDLDDAGRNLTQVLLTLRGEKDAMDDGGRFKTISDAFKDVMSGVKGIRAPLPEDDQTTVMVDEESYDVGFELSEISSGSKEILTLITKIVLARDQTDLVLIEEPELHLHPNAEKDIFQLIQDQLVEGDSPTSSTQVLVSTHSSVFAKQLEVGKAYYVERDGNTTITQKKPEEIGEKLRELGYEYSGMLQKSAIVIVEGITDETAFKCIGRKYGLDFDEYDIGVADTDGKDKMISHSRSIVKILSTFGVPYLFICDSDITEDLPDEGIPDSPKAIGGRLQDYINRENEGDDPDKRWWDKAEPENIHVWENDELEYYLLEDLDAVESWFGNGDVDVQDVLSENREEGPSEQLIALCEAKRPDITDGLSRSDKKIDIQDLSQEININNLPDEFHEVMAKIAAMVGQEDRVREAIDTREEADV